MNKKLDPFTPTSHVKIICLQISFDNIINQFVHYVTAESEMRFFSCHPGSELCNVKNFCKRLNSEHTLPIFSIYKMKFILIKKSSKIRKDIYLAHVLISKNDLIPEVRRTIKKCENDKVKMIYAYPFVVFNGLIINH